MVSKVLCDSSFSLNQPMKSVDYEWIGVLRNTIKTFGYVAFFQLDLIFPLT